MGFHDFYNLLGVRAAIRHETDDMDILVLQPLEESSQRVLLVEVYIGVPVHRLYADNHLPDDGNSNSIPQKFLVCRFSVILLGLYELMVKVQVMEGIPGQSSCSQQGVDKQLVDFPGGIELIHPAGTEV